MNGVRKVLARRGLALAILALGAPNATAQVFYAYPLARPVTDQSPSLGLFAGFGDDLIRLGGFGRFNVTPVSDLGVEVVYDNEDVEGSGEDIGYWGAGADGKYALLSATEDVPLDVSLQLGAGFEARSDYLRLLVPFGGMASHDFVVGGDRTIVPFGGVYFVVDHVSIDGGPGAADFSDTDFDVELRVGASAEIISRGSVFASLHAGHGTMFLLGFNAGI
jgi:hypothetical protein